MHTADSDSSDGATRRLFLRRVAVAGAIAWATPVMTSIRLDPAAAHSLDPSQCQKGDMRGVSISGGATSLQDCLMRTRAAANEVCASNANSGCFIGTCGGTQECITQGVVSGDLATTFNPATGECMATFFCACRCA